MKKVNIQCSFDFINKPIKFIGDTKVCNKCLQELPINCFSPHSASNYLRPECKDCNNKLSKLRKELKDIHGTAPEGYLCPICGGSEEEVSGKGNKANGAWVLDHCHERDIFRGWLCHKCNRGIGCFNDDTERLNKAISYLNQNK